MDRFGILDFLRGIILDTMEVSEIKAKVLDMYVDINKSETPLESTANEPPRDSISAFILSVPDVKSDMIPNPDAGYKFVISVSDYYTVKGLYLNNQKIQAIKHLRASSRIIEDSLMARDRYEAGSGLGLRSSKDFVEGHPWK